ncbi:hypothetical protein ACFL51_02120 [Myxococcota bacterium]
MPTREFSSYDIAFQAAEYSHREFCTGRVSESTYSNRISCKSAGVRLLVAGFTMLLIACSPSHDTKRYQPNPLPRELAQRKVDTLALLRKMGKGDKKAGEEAKFRKFLESIIYKKKDVGGKRLLIHEIQKPLRQLEKATAAKFVRSESYNRQTKTYDHAIRVVGLSASVTFTVSLGSWLDGGYMSKELRIVDQRNRHFSFSLADLGILVKAVTRKEIAKVSFMVQFDEFTLKDRKHPCIILYIFPVGRSGKKLGKIGKHEYVASAVYLDLADMVANTMPIVLREPEPFPKIHYRAAKPGDGTPTPITIRGEKVYKLPLLAPLATLERESKRFHRSPSILKVPPLGLVVTVGIDRPRSSITLSYPRSVLNATTVYAGFKLFSLVQLLRKVTGVAPHKARLVISFVTEKGQRCVNIYAIPLDKTGNVIGTMRSPRGQLAWGVSYYPEKVKGRVYGARTLLVDPKPHRRTRQK